MSNDPYLQREGAVKTYREARARARALKPKNWRHYLELAMEHGLPTQPQSLWPKQWADGGRHAGFLGGGADDGSIRERGLMSATEVRERLGIGHATWKLISVDIKPAATIRHKIYYDHATLATQLAERIDRIKRSDAREALRNAIDMWTYEPETSDE